MTSKNYIMLQATDLIFNVVYINTIALRNIWILYRVGQKYIDIILKQAEKAYQSQ